MGDPTAAATKKEKIAEEKVSFFGLVSSTNRRT
jgi:hypothetical protein